MYPNDKSLLKKEVRESVTEGQLSALVCELSSELDDQALIQKLRQIRNTFADGGKDLFGGREQFDFSSFDTKLFPLFDQFIVEKWKTGVVLIFQCYSNMLGKHRSRLLTRFNHEKTHELIQNLQTINGAGVMLTAYVYNAQIRVDCLLFDPSIYGLYMWFFIRLDDQQSSQKSLCR
jgi:hypothetical protein